MSDLEEMSPTYDFSAYCEEGGTFGVYVEVAGQQRFGPSLCMLNTLFAPVVLIALAVLGGTRISELKRLPDVKPYTNFPSVYDTAQFGLAAAGILLGMASAAMASERADTIAGLVIFAKFAGIMGLIAIENSKNVLRGKNVKCFWVIDFLYTMIRLRFILILMAFGDVPNDRVQREAASFVLSSCMLLAGLLQVPVQIRTGSSKMIEMSELKDKNPEMHLEEQEEAEIKHIKTFEGRGEGAASWWSQMAFSWITELLVKGKEQQLSDADLFPLLEEDTTYNSGERLYVNWNKQVELVGTETEPSLFKALRMTWNYDFWVAGLWKLVNDMVVFIGPLMLQALIRFVESGEQSMLEGAILALGIFGAKMVETVALGQYFQRGYRVGGQIRSGITHLVYKKSFMLSSRGRTQYKLGEMVSLMSVDAQRLCGVAPYLHQFWSAPLQLVVSVFLLYAIVGPSVFAGMFLMVLLIPVNTYIATKQTEIQRQIMKVKDERSNCMDEILQGIRIIKYFAWEESFVSKVGEIRKREVALLWSNGLWGIASMFLWGGSPMLVALITFGVYSFTGNELRASTAFTALALFNVMRFPLNTLPMIINFIVEGRTALNRLCAYLLADEVDPKYYANHAGVSKTEMSRKNNPERAIVVKNGLFSWAKTSKEEKVNENPGPQPKKSLMAKIFDKSKPVLADPEYVPTLKDVDFEIQPGELVIVCGPVGSGKSSLLGAILGDMKKDSGTVELHGRVSYVSQQNWIVNATLRDNILFGAPFNQERYTKVIEVCALAPDLEILPGGDQTEIGEKGINLSGGQKARVSLARAVYQDADVYLLDDPLSAVDVHVSKILFENCISDFLAGKTRVLVTHQLQYLQAADRVAVVDKQTVLAYGTYADVTAEHPHLVMDKKKGGSEEKMGTMSRSNSKSSMSSQEDGKEASDKAGKAVGGDGKKPAEAKSQASAADGKTITKEKREAGSVKTFVWKRYAACMGLAVTCYLVGSYVFSQSVQLASDYSLSAWSGAVSSYEADVIEYEENNKQGEAPIPIDTFSYLAVYAGLTVLAVITVTIRGFFCTLGTIRGAVVLHDTMLNNVMRAPTKFFDTTPTGRVLNRFSSDQYTADNELRQTIQMMLMCLMRVACVAAVIIWVTPTFVVCVIPMGLIYYKVQAFFRQSSREMKRLESIAKSPIFAGFSETITGVSTIRAFGKQEKFSRTCFRLNDAFARAYYANNSANRWLGIRLECIGNVAVGASALFAVINAGDPSTAGLVGLSISYALEVTGVLNWLIRTFTQLESYMVAIERIDEYSRMDTEAAAVVEANRPSYNWPESGALAFEDVWMRYRDELDPALRGIDFKTGKGEKIGIVGRTGAGKSSLAVALFRMTEIYKGKVTLDGIDVKTIGLRDLRSRMSIIPQDPVLFSGTVRKNLDPFDDATDSELWEALEKVHLKDFFKAKDEGLDYEVAEGGSNLSVGQRQLMSMARALLRKAKVIVMDEATASVDMQTDAAIQETIREQFKNTTVLTIAHRLATVMACDRVMVLGEGKVLEMGPPAELMANNESIFHQMTADHHSAEEMLG